MGNTISNSPLNGVKQKSANHKKEEGNEKEVQKVKARRKCVSGFHDSIDQTLIDSGRASLLAATNRIFFLEDPDSEDFLLEQAMNYLKVDASAPHIKRILSRVLFTSLKMINLPAGFVVHSQGDKGNNMYLVESGKLEIILDDTVISTLGSGEIFGEMSLIFGYARTATIKCTEKCVLWSLNRKTFAALRKELSSSNQLGISKRFLDISAVASLPPHYLEKLSSHSSQTMVYADGQKLCTKDRGLTKIMLIVNGFVDCAIPTYLLDMKAPKEEILKFLGISVDITSPLDIEVDRPTSSYDEDQMLLDEEAPLMIEEQKPVVTTVTHKVLPNVKEKDHNIRALLSNNSSSTTSRARNNGINGSFNVINSSFNSITGNKIGDALHKVQSLMMPNRLSSASHLLYEEGSPMRPPNTGISSKVQGQGQGQGLTRGPSTKESGGGLNGSATLLDQKDQFSQSVHGVQQIQQSELPAVTHHRRKHSITLSQSEKPSLSTARTTTTTTMSVKDKEHHQHLPQSQSMQQLQQFPKLKEKEHRQMHQSQSTGQFQHVIPPQSLQRSRNSSSVNLHNGTTTVLAPTNVLTVTMPPTSPRDREGGDDGRNSPTMKDNDKAKAASPKSAILSSLFTTKNLPSLPTAFGKNSPTTTAPASRTNSTLSVETVNLLSTTIGPKRSPGILPILSNMLGGGGGSTTENSIRGGGGSAEKPSREGITRKSIYDGQVVDVLGGMQSSSHGNSGTNGAGANRRTAEFSDRNSDTTTTTTTTTTGSSSTPIMTAIDPLINPIMQELALQARLEAAVKLIKNEEGDTFLRVGKGAVIGLGVLPSLLKEPGACEWVDDIEEGVANVGSVSAFTATAVGRVHTSFFSSFDFEKLFGPASSSLSLFESREMADFFAEAARDAEISRETAFSRAKVEAQTLNRLFRGMPKTVTVKTFVDIKPLALTSTGMVCTGSLVEDTSKKQGNNGQVYTTAPANLTTATPLQKGFGKALTSLKNAFTGGKNTSNTNSRINYAQNNSQLGTLNEDRDRNDIDEINQLNGVGVGVDKESSRTKHYALKIVYKDHALRESAVAKVLNEAKMLAEMPLSQHPFIPRLVTKFQTNHALVLVMERVTTSTCDLWSLIYELGDKENQALIKFMERQSHKDEMMRVSSLESLSLESTASMAVVSSLSSLPAGVERRASSVGRRESNVGRGESNRQSILPGSKTDTEQLFAQIALLNNQSQKGSSISQKASSSPLQPPPRKLSRRQSYFHFNPEEEEKTESFVLTIDMARFYLGSVIIVLSDLHKAGIAYRNLKAENVLIDSKGYVKMTGFGWAKRFPYSDDAYMNIRTHTLCGTPEYMAPEIIMQTGHNASVDAWALGCLMYELLVGKTPFAHVAEVVKIRQGRRFVTRADDGDCRIMAAVAEVQHKGVRFNSNVLHELESTPGALPLLEGLLLPVRSNRTLISLKPNSDLTKSEFFKDFDWTALRDMTMAPPYIPPLPYEMTDEEKEKLHKDAEAAAAAAAAQAASAVKPSYLDSTVASIASRADGKIKKKDEKIEESSEEMHSPWFDPDEPYNGDQSIFFDF